MKHSSITLRAHCSRLLQGLCVAALLCLVPARAVAQTITVTTTSMAIAFDSVCTLPEAVQAINQQSSYNGCAFTPTSAVDRIQLQQNGTFTTWDSITANRSMEIDGNGRSSTVLSSGGAWGFAARSGATLTLTDMTIRRRSDQPASFIGVYVDGPSSVELDNVRIHSCSGSGVYITGDGIDGNQNFLTDATIVDSLIENNVGPGITNSQALLNVSTSTIRNNDNANGNGGGILNIGDLLGGGAGVASTNVYDSTIENNTAMRGGGIYNGDNGPDTKANVYRSLIRNNVANFAGGGYFCEGQFVMESTTVTENWARDYGAGIYHSEAEMQILQCTISGNGGTRNGITTLVGGGVYAQSAGNRLVFYNIIANNDSFAHDDISGDGFIGTNNLIENPFGSTGFEQNNILWQDPLLGTLQSLGGPTRVLPPLAGSPAIDRINNPTWTFSLVDQRGSPRQKEDGTPRNGDDGSGLLGYDIGAFEQGAFETEFLTVTAKTSSVNHAVYFNDGFSKDEGTRLDATANGHYVTYAVPVLSTGTYAFRIRVRRGSNRGIYQVATSNSPTTGFTDEGSQQDLYAPLADFRELALGGATVNFTTTGTKYIRFTVSGKHPSSSSRSLHLDWIQLVKQ